MGSGKSERDVWRGDLLVRASDNQEGERLLPDSTAPFRARLCCRRETALVGRRTGQMTIRHWVSLAPKYFPIQE